MSSRLKSRWQAHLLALITLGLVLLRAPVAIAAEAILDWDKPSDPDIGFYEVHWGTSSGNYIHSLEDRNLIWGSNDLWVATAKFFTGGRG